MEHNIWSIKNLVWWSEGDSWKGELSILYPSERKKSFMHKVGGPSSGQAINDIATKDNLISISSGVGNVQLLEFGENNSSNLSLVRTYDESAKFISLSRKYIYLNGSSIGTQIRDLETDNVIKEYYKHNQMHCYHHGNEIFLGTDSFHLDDVT